MDAEGAAQLKHSLADVAGAIVHQLNEETRKCIRRIQERGSCVLMMSPASPRTSNTHLLRRSRQTEEKQADFLPGLVQPGPLTS